MIKSKIILKGSKKNNYNFPPEKELKRVREKEGVVNIVLPKNATFLEKVKYETCQAILAYQQDNRLTYKGIAQKIGISSEQTVDMLRGNIASFALDSLITYAEKLNIPCQVKITSEETFIPARKTNGRLRKHL